jgi:ABC-2 type transport system permease protein
VTGRLVRRAVRVAAARSASDHGALVFTAAFYLMVTAVLSSLWSAAAGRGDVAGYSAVALAWYVATSEAATIPLNFRMIEDVGDDIGSGAVSTELLRPVSVVGTRVVTEVGRMLPKLAVCIAVGVAFVLLVHGAPPRPLALVLAVPSLVLALSLNIVAQHAFAAAAFWIHDAKSTWFLYQKLVFVLGGMLLPLEVLPDALEAVARWLPFAAMAYAPARLASGHVEPGLLLVQLGWLAALGWVAHASFRAGERRLQVVGG